LAQRKQRRDKDELKAGHVEPRGEVEEEEAAAEDVGTVPTKYRPY
jgi:hypothetical protein